MLEWARFEGWGDCEGWEGDFRGINAKKYTLGPTDQTVVLIVLIDKKIYYVLFITPLLPNVLRTHSPIINIMFHSECLTPPS